MRGYAYKRVVYGTRLVPAKAMPPLKKHQKAAKKAWKRKRANENKSKSTNRPKKLKQWDDESMRLAIEAVQSGQMAAAREFDVPAATLKDRLSGRVEHGSKPGPAPYLTDHEEAELAKFLIDVSQIGYSKTKREVLMIVQKTLEKKEVDISKFKGEGWWIHFKCRHPEISLRTTDPLSMVRVNAVTQETFDAYFNLLEKNTDRQWIAE